MDQPIPASPDSAAVPYIPANADSIPVTIESTLAADPALSREEFWRNTIREQAASGKTISDFCRERGLTYSNFHRWKRTISEAVVTTTAPTLPAHEDATANDAPEQLHASASLSQTIAPLPRFAEIRLSAPRQEESAPAGLELRCGKFTMTVRPDCDRPLLREVLVLLGEVSC